jgi:hypothetical protein
VVRKFDIPRGRLRSKLEGIPAKIRRLVINIRFTKPEEKVLYRYIDRFDYINLIIRLEFIRETINAILQTKLKNKVNGLDFPIIS